MSDPQVQETNAGESCGAGSPLTFFSGLTGNHCSVRRANAVAWGGVQHTADV